MEELSDEQRIKLTADLRTAILETELSGKSHYIYKFSYAGAANGYSFAGRTIILPTAHCIVR